METKNGQQKYTRAQLRAAERLKEEADRLHQNLCGKFVHFFMNNDPDSLPIYDKRKELAAKWRMFCHHNQIKPEFYDSIDNFCKKYVEEFNEKRGPKAATGLEKQIDDLQFEKANYKYMLERIPMWVRKIFKAV